MPRKFWCKRGTGGVTRPVARFTPLPLMCVFLFSTLCALFFSALPVDATVHAMSADTPVKLKGHVPTLEQRSSVLGATNPNISIQVAVGLQPRRAGAMLALARSMSAAHTRSAHHYLTTQQLVREFAPGATSQNAVIAFMHKGGFQLTKTYATQMMLDFKGTIGEAEQTFTVQIKDFRAPSGRVYYAPTADPTIPASLQSVIQSVIGLDTAMHLSHPPVQKKHVTPKPGAGVKPQSSCPPPSSGSGYFTPAQLARGYNLLGLYDEGMTGQGQTIGLFELDTYDGSDITAYTDCFLGGNVPITNVSIDSPSGTPGPGAVEVELDMELVLSGAPGLKSLRVYDAPNTDTGVIDEYSAMVGDGVPVISTSWGLCEVDNDSSFLYQENNIFATATLLGETILAASGDNGSQDCSFSGIKQSRSLSPKDGTPFTATVDDPASQPFVTGVGGTSLNLNSNSTYKSEVVWNNISGAGGGGVSRFWPMPPWQQGPGVIDPTYSSGKLCGLQTNYYCREVPDVSLNADPANGYLLYCTIETTEGTPGPCDAANPWGVIGGTSAAAPMWAVMVALANQRSQRHGGTDLGFLNPILYQVEQNAAGMPYPYSSAFHDITVGTNYTSGDGYGEYPAKANYDMASGLGSYDAQKLAIDLFSIAAPLASSTPVSKTWYFAEGRVGQGFTEYLTLSNPDTTTACSVNIKYLLGTGSPVNIAMTVAAASRSTRTVNNDLHTPTNARTTQVVSMIVTTTNSACKGVVAERPMYFTNFMGISSGTNAEGASGLSTLEYFAGIPTGTGFHSFITVMNPSTSSSIHVSVHYFNNGSELSGSPQTLTIPASARGTIVPPHYGMEVATYVSSDGPMAVEVPLYFLNVQEGNAGTVSGASIEEGRGFPSASTIFPEGYTGTGFQTNLVISNLAVSSTEIADVYLDYNGGAYQEIQVPVAADSAVELNINDLNASPVGTCTPSPCQVTPEFAIDVYSNDGAPITAEREEYFHYAHTGNQRYLAAMGGTHSMGLSTYLTPQTYSFAEGYVYPGYDEWLTLYNNYDNPTMVSVTLNSALHRSVTRHFLLQAFERYTVDITALVLQYLIHPGDGSQAYQVSMTVSGDNPIVAERPMYWNTGNGGTQGGTVALGFNAFSNQM